jgi:hypothetical protein
MAPETSQLLPREAKRRKEWQEAEDRRKKTRHTQDQPPRNSTTANSRVENLEAALEKESERRTRAESFEAARYSSVSTPVVGSDPVGSLEAVIDQLNDDYGMVSYNVDTEHEIAGRIRAELAKQLQVICIYRIDEAKRLVDELRRRLQGSQELEETEVVSEVKSAVITITQQLQALNRSSFDLKRRTGGVKKKAGPIVTCETAKLPLTESLGFDELLKEFKEAAGVPISYVKLANSLREQLRVAESSQWKAENYAHNARLAARQAQVQLGHIQYKGQRPGGREHDLFLQLEQCRKRGEEMEREILKLRNLLESASNTPVLPRDGEVPFTRHESRVLLKLIEGFTQSSGNYQTIIKDLEKGEVACEDAKRRLQVQISHLRDEDDPSHRLQEADFTAMRLITGLEARVEDVKAQGDRAERTLSDLQEQWDADKTKYKAQIKDLTAERNSLASDVDYMQKKLDAGAAGGADAGFVRKRAYKNLPRHGEEWGGVSAQMRENLEKQRALVASLSKELSDGPDGVEQLVTPSRDLREEFYSLQTPPDDLQTKGNVAVEECKFSWLMCCLILCR